MIYVKAVCISISLSFVLCVVKAQSTFSVEYGRKYSSFENTGIYLVDAQKFKDQNTFTNFFSINYQVKLFSKFHFETGILSESRNYDLAFPLQGNIKPTTFSNFYKAEIKSLGIPLRVNYSLQIGKRFSLDPSLGFIISFNEFNRNLDGLAYGRIEYALGKVIKAENWRTEKVQEKIVFIPSFSMRLNYNIFHQFKAFIRADFQWGFTTMHQLDYKFKFTEGDVITDEYEGSLINKGASINVSFGLSYTLKKKSE